MTGSSILTSARTCERWVRCHSPKGSPLTAITRSFSTMPQEVCPFAVNFSQRMRFPFLFRRDLRLAFPCAGGRARQPEIFAHGLVRIILVKQPAALQFWNDVAHEIGVRPRHIGGRDDKAVAAAAHEHLFEPVRDLLRP